MKKQVRRRLDMVCPICGITFSGLSHSKTCGALHCANEFRKRSTKETWYQKQQRIKVLKLRNGIGVLNNVFGKELANAKVDK